MSHSYTHRMIEELMDLEGSLKFPLEKKEAKNLTGDDSHVYFVDISDACLRLEAGEVVPEVSVVLNRFAHQAEIESNGYTISAAFEGEEKYFAYLRDILLGHWKKRNVRTTVTFLCGDRVIASLDLRCENDKRNLAQHSSEVEGVHKYYNELMNRDGEVHVD